MSNNNYMNQPIICMVESTAYPTIAAMWQNAKVGDVAKRGKATFVIVEIEEGDSIEDRAFYGSRINEQGEMIRDEINIASIANYCTIIAKTYGNMMVIESEMNAAFEKANQIATQFEMQFN